MQTGCYDRSTFTNRKHFNPSDSAVCSILIMICLDFSKNPPLPTVLYANMGFMLLFLLVVGRDETWTPHQFYAVKAFFFPEFLIRWCLGGSSLFCRISQAEENENEHCWLWFYFVKKSSYQNVSCENNHWIAFGKISLPLSLHLVRWIILVTWISAMPIMHFASLCCALHHCSEIDFLRLSHHAVRAGSRKCLLPWHSVNVMLWQTLLSDTWQGARLPSGLPRKCADACACVHVRASFPASLMRRFLRLFVFSQTGGWLCTGGSWEISLRGQGVLKVLPSLTSSLFTGSLDRYIRAY